MEILVDYNNVQEVDRRKGVMFVVDKIVHTLGSALLVKSSHINIRLYDGWYENQTPTRKCQEIAAEVEAGTPTTLVVEDGQQAAKVIVNVELAYSLKSAPAQHIWHTYRPTYYPSDVKCRNPRAGGCNDPQCPLAAMHYFFTRRSCPKPECRVTPEALLYRSQQKLVDTMIAADLFALHLQSSRRIAVVTSDDDIWPAIKLVLQLNVEVFHIHTIPGRRTPPMYCRNAGSGYIQLQL
jgi:uncharacterized LabA/DUF88 family protein